MLSWVYRARASWLRWLLVVALLGGACGCAVRLVYNQLDWVIPWYLKDYMALTGDQEDRFQKRVDDYLYWHRVDQLPQYAAFLRAVAVQAEDGLDRSEIAVIQTRSEAFANILLREIAPHVIALFAAANEKQIRQLFKRLDEDNRKYRRENIDISERAKRKQAANDARRYVERWVGGLSDQQDALIRKWSTNYQPMGEEILQARIVWQQRLKEILALRHKQPTQYEQATQYEQPTQYEKQLTELLNDRKFGRSQAFDNKLDHNSEMLITLYQTLDASLTPAQRKRLIKQLNSYADDFVVLSNEAEKKETEKKHG